MKGQVEGMDIKSQLDLEDAIFKQWQEIPDEVVQSCIEHLKHHLIRVIEADGDPPSRAT